MAREREITDTLVDLVKAVPGNVSLESMLTEIGKLGDRDLQREINEGLSVVESWNGGNSIIFYGKGGDITTNRRD